LSEEQKLEILNENEGDNRGALATLRTAPTPAANKAWNPPPPPPKSGLCLANTTLMLLRLVGRYTHLARLLHPIAGEILRGMAQMVQYYVYTVHAFFVVVEGGGGSGGGGGEGGGEESEKLKQFISSVYATVIRHEVVMTSAAAAAVEETAAAAAAGGSGDQQQPRQLLRQLVGLVSEPQISPIVALNRKGTLVNHNTFLNRTISRTGLPVL
jgi:hypothetical protein